MGMDKTGRGGGVRDRWIKPGDWGLGDLVINKYISTPN